MSHMAAKRGRTAFFLFSEEQREATRAECIEKADAPTKVSVATVAKAIGEKWRALSEEEKAAYKERAQAAAVPDPEDDRGGGPIVQPKDTLLHVAPPRA